MGVRVRLSHMCKFSRQAAVEESGRGRCIRLGNETDNTQTKISERTWIWRQIGIDSAVVNAQNRATSALCHGQGK